MTEITSTAFNHSELSIHYRYLSPYDPTWLLDALTVYVKAMNYPHIVAARQLPSWREHMSRPGIRIIGAFWNDNLVGIAFGFPGEQSSRWCQELKNALRSHGKNSYEVDIICTNYFELSELHVHPHFHGKGIGTQLIIFLLENQPYSHVMLSTPEVAGESNGAWRLYRKIGFQDIIRNHYFPGDFRSFAILGRKFPIPFSPSLPIEGIPTPLPKHQAR